MIYSVSVIVPIYQAESILHRCINSILKQTFIDYELLLVNDGSVDKSGCICDKYAKDNKNIRVFHQKNAGPSAARNKGIDAAKGKYIVFIDADDFVDENFLRNFFLQEKNPENTLVQQGYVKVAKNGIEKPIHFTAKRYPADQFSELFFEINFIKNFPFPWAKLYERKLIIDQNIRFKPEIRYGEDLIFILDYILQIDKIIINDNCGYYYINDEGSLSTSYQAYQKEIQRFLLVKERIDLVDDKFQLSSKAQGAQYAHMANYLTRVFSSLYVGKNKKTRKKRMKIYKNFDLELFDFIKQNYNAKNISRKVFKFLFANHLFGVLDLFMLLRASKKNSYN